MADVSDPIRRSPALRRGFLIVLIGSAVLLAGTVWLQLESPSRVGWGMILLEIHLILSAASGLVASPGARRVLLGTSFAPLGVALALLLMGMAV